MRIFKRRDSDPSDPQLTGLRFDQVGIEIFSKVGLPILFKVGLGMILKVGLVLIPKVGLVITYNT